MIKTQTKVTNKFTFNSYTSELVWELMKKGDVEAAHRLCDELLAETGDIALLINRAMVERSIDCYRLSLATLETVVTDDPQLLGNLHCGLGISCWGLKRFDDALIHYVGAVEFYRQAGNDFYASRTLNNLSNCLVDLGKPDEALKYLDEAEKGLSDSESLSELFDTKSRALKAWVKINGC